MAKHCYTYKRMPHPAIVILITFLACALIYGILLGMGILHWPNGPGANPPVIG